MDFKLQFTVRVCEGRREKRFREEVVLLFFYSTEILLLLLFLSKIPSCDLYVLYPSLFSRRQVTSAWIQALLSSLLHVFLCLCVHVCKCMLLQPSEYLCNHSLTPLSVLRPFALRKVTAHTHWDRSRKKRRERFRALCATGHSFVSQENKREDRQEGEKEVAPKDLHPGVCMRLRDEKTTSGWRFLQLSMID